jgi:hypothetical protein
VSAFLRECAVEFGSADTALPGAMRNEFAAGRFFTLRDVVERNAARCPWLAEKVLACRSGAPMPAAALAPDVTRHDVNWGAEGARRHANLQLTHGGFGLSGGARSLCWAQGPVGVTSGKHWFQVSVTGGAFMVGFVDDKIKISSGAWPGMRGTQCSGAALSSMGLLHFGSAPVTVPSFVDAPICIHVTRNSFVSQRSSRRRRSPSCAHATFLPFSLLFSFPHGASGRSCADRAAPRRRLPDRSHHRGRPYEHRARRLAHRRRRRQQHHVHPRPAADDDAADAVRLAAYDAGRRPGAGRSFAFAVPLSSARPIGSSGRPLQRRC